MIKVNVNMGMSTHSIIFASVIGSGLKLRVQEYRYIK